MARRRHGDGQLYRQPADGQLSPGQRQAWYGRWRVGDRKVNRKIGMVRVVGDREGLTELQAHVKLHEMMVRTVAPIATGNRLTVGAIGTLYLADLERKGRKPETLRAAEVAIRTHGAPFFDPRAADTITREDIERLALHMGQQGARSSKRGLAPKSIRNYLGTLSALFNYAVKKGYASTNPVTLVDLPQNDSSKEIRYLTPDEVRALVAAVPDGAYQETDQALYLTAAMTGLRIGELRALRWRDVDWTASRVRVRRNYVRGRFGTPKTRRGSRSVPLADEVSAALDAQSRRVAARDNALVFPDPITSEPLDDNAIRDRFALALRAALLPRHTPHDLRHTFGTAMAAEGVPMRTLQEWMGHADIATTQIYADYAPSHREAEMVARAFGRRSSVQPSVQPERI